MGSGGGDDDDNQGAVARRPPAAGHVTQVAQHFLSIGWTEYSPQRASDRADSLHGAGVRGAAVGSGLLRILEVVHILENFSML